ncbi:MAG: ribosomal RNA small subunit methyltransferase I, partial [Caldimonas sp.]
MTTRGTLYLVPNSLDVGTADAGADLGERLPLGTLRVAARLVHWVCENAKTTRAFLKRVDAVSPLLAPLQQIAIVELPRRPKGRADSAAFEGERLLAPALAGSDLGLISEAGLPAVADPGARLVAAAHGAGLRVVALPGASAIT